MEEDVCVSVPFSLLLTITFHAHSHASVISDYRERKQAKDKGKKDSNLTHDF